MRIAVTGASGFIGRRLVDRLSAEGHSIVALDRRDCEDRPLRGLVRCELTEPDSYETALRGVECVCHLAAAKGDWGISEAEYRRDNTEATGALVAAAARQGVGRWIFYSTVSVLGPSPVPLDESAPRRPVNAYGSTKAECEALFERYVARTPDASVLVLRPSVVFGPGNPWNTNIFRLIEAIHRGRFLMIGAGQEIKTTSYVDNLLDANLHLMRRPQRKGLEIYHYVDEPAETTAAIVRCLYELLGRPGPRLRLPLAIASPLALAGDAAARLLRVDLPITSARVRKFCTATNFAANRIRESGYVQRVGNREAMRQTVHWYLSQVAAAA